MLLTISLRQQYLLLYREWEAEHVKKKTFVCDKDSDIISYSSYFYFIFKFCGAWQCIKSDLIDLIPFN